MGFAPLHPSYAFSWFQSVPKGHEQLLLQRVGGDLNSSEKFPPHTTRTSKFGSKKGTGMTEELKVMTMQEAISKFVKDGMTLYISEVWANQ
jgi:hypothetical protein